MKDPDDPGTSDMASIWGEVIPPRNPQAALKIAVELTKIFGDEKEKQTPGPTQVDTRNGQDAG